MKTPFYKKKWFIVVAVVCVLAIIGNAVSGNKNEEETKDEKKIETTAPVLKEEVEEVKEEEIPKTPEERISAYINNELGERTNNNKDRIVSVGYVVDTLEIVLNADDNLTTSLTKTSMLTNASEIFEQIQGYEDVDGDVIVGFMIDLVDQSGNTEAGKVLSIRLTQEELNKLNFQNFDYNNYKAIADVYFEHPAIQ